MMSISDIFDALTAADRPYKRAVPVQKALDILGFEVKDGHIDGDLVRIFVEARIWEPVMAGQGPLSGSIPERRGPTRP
jgi:HD-GYP domain-containing protein (c-di-GMP phosphodiesterase class II)